MDYVAYTIFADRSLAEVREVAHLHGAKAREVVSIWKASLGRDPREGETIADHGIRIDRIGFALNATHIRLLKRGARSKWIWLSDDAGTLVGEVVALGELERAGLVKPAADELPPGPPAMRPSEITDAGREALEVAMATAAPDTTEALRNLVNAVFCLGGFGPEIKALIGVTNWNALEYRVQEARAAIAKAA